MSLNINTFRVDILVNISALQVYIHVQIELSMKYDVMYKSDTCNIPHECVAVTYYLHL